MKIIKTMNKIADIGLNELDKGRYTISDATDNPDAIMVRSASLHDVDFGYKLTAIVRCGAGVNNIPVDKCAEKGIVVFNTPGANANGVKELTVAALLLASRDIYGGITWAKGLTGDDVAKQVEKGKGAFLNGKPMQVSSTPFSSSLIAYGTAGYYKDKLGNATFEMSKEIFMTARDGDVRRCGSAALDLAYLAAGRNDLFFELMLSPWDIAAASLLITEAGGIISDMDGNPIDLSRPSPILAGNPVAYPQLLEIAKKYRV